MATAYPQSSDSDDSDNNLPGLDPEAKILAPKQEVFMNPFEDKNVRGLKYKKGLKTTNKHLTCWRSTDKSKILLGGWNNSYITVLHYDRREFVYELPGDNISVLSGVSITDEKSLLITNSSAITVNITQETPAGSMLHSVNTLNVEDPWCVFPITKQEYGILCDGNRIEFFTLKNVLMDDNSSNTGFMEIDLPDPNPHDTACALPDGTICVAPWLDGAIIRYDNVGHRLGVFGEKRLYYSRVRPGHLYRPRSIQRCGDTMLVSCLHGDVHTYQDGAWKLLIDNDHVGDMVRMNKEKEKKTGGFWNLFRKKTEKKEQAGGSGDERMEEWKMVYTVCSESMLWAIQYKDFNPSKKVYVYDVSHN